MQLEDFLKAFRRSLAERLQSYDGALRKALVKRTYLLTCGRAMELTEIDQLIGETIKKLKSGEELDDGEED